MANEPPSAALLHISMSLTESQPSNSSTCMAVSGSTVGGRTVGGRTIVYWQYSCVLLSVQGDLAPLLGMSHAHVGGFHVNRPSLLTTAQGTAEPICTCKASPMPHASGQEGELARPTLPSHLVLSGAW